MPDSALTASPPGGEEWRWSWQARAACRGLVELFFHPAGEREPARSQRESAAKDLCLRCPVREDCGQFAISMREPYGTWGGMSEQEREAAVLGPHARRAAEVRRAKEALARERALAAGVSPADRQSS